MMVFDHDFAAFPELANTQLEVLRFTSPHPQISEDFEAVVVRVHDGDTVTLRTSFRDFDFPLRFLDIDAPEMNAGGAIARDWLHNELMDASVQVRIDKNNRVDKYGRLLGRIYFNGLDIGQTMLYLGLVRSFSRRYEGQLPDINKELRIEKWL